MKGASDAHKSQDRRHAVYASSSFLLSREVLGHHFLSQIDSELVFVIIYLFLKLAENISVASKPIQNSLLANNWSSLAKYETVGPFLTTCSLDP
jgi:hypothetical protein